MSDRTFQCLLVATCLIQLAPLGSLLVVRPFSEALWMASLGYFVFAAVMLALWLLTEGKTTPPLPSMGLGLLFWSMMTVAASCLLSIVCGLFCMRAYPWVLFWLAPTALLLAAIGLVT